MEKDEDSFDLGQDQEKLTLAVSPSGVLKKKKLLILDINGVFCRKLAPNIVFKLVKAFKKGEYPNYCIKVPKSKIGIEFRPGYKDFFETLRYKYHIAIFSSSTFWNCTSVLDVLPEMQWEFLWYRDHTHRDPDIGTTGVDGYATIKKLDDVYDNPVINEKGEWSEHNTVIVDDSPAKMRFNNPNNVIIVRSFIDSQETADDRVLSDLLALIEGKFAAIEGADDDTSWDIEKK